MLFLQLKNTYILLNENNDNSCLFRESAITMFSVFQGYHLFFSLELFPASPKAHGTETAGEYQFSKFALLAPNFH